LNFDMLNILPSLLKLTGARFQPAQDF